MASVLLGLGVVAALTAIEVGIKGADVAYKQGYGRCLVRTESEYIEAAPYVAPSAPYYYPLKTGLTVSNEPVTSSLARVTITYTDPQGLTSYSTVVMKTPALSPGSDLIHPAVSQCPWPSP